MGGSQWFETKRGVIVIDTPGQAPFCNAKCEHRAVQDALQVGRMKPKRIDRLDDPIDPRSDLLSVMSEDEIMHIRIWREMNLYDYPFGIPTQSLEQTAVEAKASYRDDREHLGNVVMPNDGKCQCRCTDKYHGITCRLYASKWSGDFLRRPT